MKEESHPMDNLLAARDILRCSIEKSRDIAVAVHGNGSSLKETSHNLVHLQAAIRNMAHKCAVHHEIRDHVDRAVGPAAAIPKVLDLVHELQDSLRVIDPRGLLVYLNNIKRLQYALKLLADNSRLVILWLQDVVQFLKNNTDDDDYWYLLQVSRVLKMLFKLQKKGESGDAISDALDNLESEFRHRITEEISSFEHSRIQEVRGIIEVLETNNRLERCMSIYAEARIAKARATLRSQLDVDYLDIRLSETDSIQSVECYIDQWDEHMEFAVRYLLRREQSLCSEVFHHQTKSRSSDCFAKIAAQCGFTDILEFGSRVCRCKKEAIKLLRLLRIFSTLDKLRLEFNEMFDGRFCREIQNQTRDLVKSVVDGACEIFWQLSLQVELQRAASNKPLPDGGIAGLVYFVTEYCNQLLEEDNSSMLIRVLEIHQAWNDDEAVKSGLQLLSSEIHNIMKALEINLETWAKRYNDKALSYLFMMNNYWYLCLNIRGTNLEELMGSSWVCKYEESSEYYAALYMGESWGKLLVLLEEDDLTLFPGGRAIDRNLVKKRIGLFSEAFDDMCKKQSKWMLSGKALRWKTCQLIAEAIVPPYKRYLERYVMSGLEHEGDLVKYSAESLESLICSLFQPNLGNYGSSKCADLIGIENAAAMNRLSSTPAAA